MSWKRNFPDGRTIFYEGDNPEGFRQQIKTAFGFDVAGKPGDLTGNYTEETIREAKPTWNEERGWSFHCPPEHLDAIYGNDRFPMGS